LDARPIRFDRTFQDGDSATWREYRFRFSHLPGQSYFTMGVQTEIDGKTCFFTADNFFHHQQYSGTGGWMGLNRSSPIPYGQSAEKVLDAEPEWILAEHGGPFAFDAEDFRRRAEWGKVGAAAADTVCVSGDHQRDWNPHRVGFEPVLQQVKPGELVEGLLRVTNPGREAEQVSVTLEGRGLVPDQTWELRVEPGRTEERAVQVTLAEGIEPGRHVFALRNSDAAGMETVDAFLAVEVER
jgi:hypothetical protein